MKKLLLLIFGLCLASSVIAVEDSTDVIPADSLLNDSLQQPVFDSLFYDTLPDTLTEGQRKLLEFEHRQQQMKKEKEEISEKYLPQFVWFDSFTVTMLSERLNYYNDVKRSFYRNAGDFFKSNPSYFSIDYENTPMRATIQPFGLTGNRLGVFYNGIALNPFDHVVEPDGMMDMNDIPTASSEAIYIIPGPVSRLIGGQQTVASLITRADQPDSYDTESTLLVDKGGFGYNFVRGRYSKLFTGGKVIDMSVEYRSADGLNFIERDDSYQYAGKAYFPIGNGFSLRFQGNSYNRSNNIFLVNSGTTYYFKRARVDRTAEISIQKQTEQHDRKLQFGYRYQKKTSAIDDAYRTRNYNFENGLFISREFKAGSALIKAELSGREESYFNGYHDFDRQVVKAYLSILKPSTSWSYLLSAGADYMETYKTLPFGGLMLKQETDHHLFQYTLGYSERAPTLYELNLIRQSDKFLSTGFTYQEEGNTSLVSEKQVVASLLHELGTKRNNIRLTVTGGKIINAIDWNALYHETDTLTFAPLNQDISFADINLTTRLALNDLITLTTGGAYHWQEYEIRSDKPYTPDFQIFSGAELHLYWKQKYTDLFAYTEIVFTDLYYGYDNTIMGQEPIVNGKLSFHLKDFRFHVIFQNILSRLYQNREGYYIPGRYTSYGFTWNFLN